MSLCQFLYPCSHYSTANPPVIIKRRKCQRAHTMKSLPYTLNPYRRRGRPASAPPTTFPGRWNRAVTCHRDIPSRILSDNNTLGQDRAYKISFIWLN